MDVLPALTSIATARVRAQFAPSNSAAPAQESGRLLDRMRESLADALARASRAVAPQRPRPAH